MDFTVVRTARLAAERVDELNDAAHVGEGGHLQHISVVEIEDALVAVLLQQRIKDGTSLRPVFGEHVALLHVLGPFAAREGLGVEGDMADQVERIEIFSKLVSDGIEG